jgi:hypothetical protein
MPPDNCHKASSYKSMFTISVWITKYIKCTIMPQQMSGNWGQIMRECTIEGSRLLGRRFCMSQPCTSMKPNVSGRVNNETPEVRVRTDGRKERKQPSQRGIQQRDFVNFRRPWRKQGISWNSSTFWDKTLCSPVSHATFRINISPPYLWLERRLRKNMK